MRHGGFLIEGTGDRHSVENEEAWSWRTHASNRQRHRHRSSHRAKHESCNNPAQMMPHVGDRHQIADVGAA